MSDRERRMDVQYFGSTAEARRKCRPIWGQPMRYSARHEGGAAPPAPAHEPLPDCVREVSAALVESPEVVQLRHAIAHERRQAQHWYEVAMGRPAGMESESLRCLEEDVRCWRARALAAEEELDRLIAGMERGRTVDPRSDSEMADERVAMADPVILEEDEEGSEEWAERDRARREADRARKLASRTRLQP